MRCLGYIVSCNGDTRMMRDRALGCLQGVLRRNHHWLSKSYVPQFVKAHWWRLQVNGQLNWIAPWVIPSKELTRRLEVVGNAGPRAVARLPSNFLVRATLQDIQHEFRVHVPYIFYSLLVNRLGHIFQHENRAFFEFLRVIR